MVGARSWLCLRGSQLQNVTRRMQCDVRHRAVRGNRVYRRIAFTGMRNATRRVTALTNTSPLCDFSPCGLPPHRLQSQRRQCLGVNSPARTRIKQHMDDGGIAPVQHATAPCRLPAWRMSAIAIGGCNGRSTFGRRNLRRGLTARTSSRSRKDKKRADRTPGTHRRTPALWTFKISNRRAGHAGVTSSVITPVAPPNERKRSSLSL